ncbi:ferredoxin family protein [Azospirillum rugosum]|uniref:Ferredoxin-like protein n=1 Tax=Azospirillum rugosum TaxID=416170 RepID=A0ABS4SQ91_9PROT|nr:ferredoxin family protein [Azospirillum rugosum]MBP2294127.1 ferredoxin like protein [Azospirillum rugosum]MDQ0527484.1 ferredoxin like protein [Azospirillum rugosum]
MSIVVKIEEKLYQNRYIVDESRPHIRIRSEAECKSCTSQACTVCCPAACYSKNEAGTVTLVTDGCLECGTCRVICQDKENIQWDYPRGGYGISYKFG